MAQITKLYVREKAETAEIAEGIAEWLAENDEQPLWALGQTAKAAMANCSEEVRKLAWRQAMDAYFGVA